MKIEYQRDAIPSKRELVELYDSVGWTSYTRDPALLAGAIQVSLTVVTARAEGELIGLARAVGDGLTIVYLQDILVSPSYHRHGIGRELFERVFAPYGSVRQKVLLTDDEPAQHLFYRAMGFTETWDMSPAVHAFAKF